MDAGSAYTHTLQPLVHLKGKYESGQANLSASASPSYGLYKIFKQICPFSLWWLSQMSCQPSIKQTMFPFKITVHNDVSIGIVSRGGGLEVSMVARYSDEPSSKFAVSILLICCLKLLKLIMSWQNHHHHYGLRVTYILKKFLKWPTSLKSNSFHTHRLYTILA